MFAAGRIRLDNESLPELGIWSGENARGAALFRQDGKSANGGYLKIAERQCSLLPALPASASLLSRPEGDYR